MVGGMLERREVDSQISCHCEGAVPKQYTFFCIHSMLEALTIMSYEFKRGLVRECQQRLHRQYCSVQSTARAPRSVVVV